MQHRPVIKKKPKKATRRFGLGLAGRWLNRKLKKSRLSSTVAKQLEEISDHRLAL